MAEASRSLSACLRCRRLKLKCGGPGQIPCQRCRTTNSECLFVPPRATRSKGTSAGPPGLESNDKITRLEQRLERMEEHHHAELQELRSIVGQLTTTSSLSNGLTTSPRTGIETTSPVHITRPTRAPLSTPINIVSHEVASEGIPAELHALSVIAFLDDQYPSANVLKNHPLMSTVICVIAARAIKPEHYLAYLNKADDLIKGTFQGPTPDLLAVRAMMLLAAWTGRLRLWGYIISLAVELGLNTATLQIANSNVDHSEETIECARTWYSLCCFDLVFNLNRPFVIPRMRDYLAYSKELLSSEYRRPVDYRICAYIDGFTIAADAKAQIKNSQLQIHPLPQELANLLGLLDDRVDRWFYEINNNIDPLYQTFSVKQDRNRFLMAYAFMRTYVNGFALHGMESTGQDIDTSRVVFIQKALDSAILLLRSQLQSEQFREALRYTMDYNGTTTYHAVNFILRCAPVIHKQVDCSKALGCVREVAQMFENAGAVDAANDLRQEQERVAALAQTALSPEAQGGRAMNMENVTLFDIPSFLDDATWNDNFPTVNDHTLDW